MTIARRPENPEPDLDLQSRAVAGGMTADDGLPERTVFVARQPILDRHLEVFGYELLFRSGRQNFHCFHDGDQATRLTVSNALNVMGLNDLVSGKKAFVNITRNLLLQEFHAVLPLKQGVVELLETVEPDEEVIAACRAMKEEGYLLALDDFVFSPRYQPLLDIADIVKVDFLATDRRERRALIENSRRPGLVFLAEKVEGHQEFEEGLALGYALFQGYFFSKPKIVESRDFVGAKHKYMLFLQEVHSPELDFDRLEKVVKSDASLSVKLLRYLNSAGMGVRERITSIKQALILLGEKPLRKWASLVALTCIGEDKPSELIRLSLARAHFCESLCSDLKMTGRELDLFLLGLLSALDAMLDCSPEDLVEQLPLATDVKTTLLGGSGTLGKVYMLVQACEHADWKTACLLGRLLEIEVARINETYSHSLRWADEVMRI
ncbi:MAG: HDOD domain-containing protein [Phycisphaerales bacterium]|nr:MAG: HDOD domain-containing protein [Phycisphaerales bacterium]